MYVTQKLSQTALVLILIAGVGTSLACADPKWAVIRCAAFDNPTPLINPAGYSAPLISPAGRPEVSDQFYQDFFTSSGKGKGGMYWSQMSSGSTSLDGTYVFPWVLLDKDKYSYSGTTSTTAITSLGFAIAAQTCLDATIQQEAGPIKDKGVQFFDDFYGLFVLMNVDQSPAGEQGSAGTQLNFIGEGPPRTIPLVVFSIGVLNEMNVAHEMGHGYGLDHAWDTQMGCGEYCDWYDPMGAPINGTYYVNPAFQFQTKEGLNVGMSGPGLNAQHLAFLGWRPASKVFVFDETQPNTMSVTLAALGTSSSNFYEVGIPIAPVLSIYRTPGASSYSVEFRRQKGWDSGFSSDGILIHRGWSLNGSARTYLVDEPRPLWTPKQTYKDVLSQIEISIDSVDPVKDTATITPTRHPEWTVPLPCGLYPDPPCPPNNHKPFQRPHL